MAAYLRLVSVLLTLRALAMCFAPSAFKSFEEMLQTRVKSACQGLLTVGKRGGGGILGGGEGGICLEGLGERLCTLCTDVVVSDAASRGKFGVSAAADSRI